MTYQRANHGDINLPLMEAARPKQSSLPWRAVPNGGLWGAICGWLSESFRQRAESRYLTQPDWERQLRRDLLRIDARRIR